MTTEEFNALPLEARRFIETHAGCLSCGNPANKLTRAYELYKAHKMANVYTLFGGGINYVVDDKKGILYNVKEEDTPFEIRKKLALAEKIHAKSPHVFMTYDKNAIKELEASLPAEEVVDLRTDEEKAAEAKAIEEAAEAHAKRSEVLGIDTKTAKYPELQAYVTEKGLAPKGKKQKDLIEAIDAIDTNLL
jgi:hypothetical protein